MNHHLFANPPPLPFFAGLAIGVLVVAGLIVVFLRRRAWARTTRAITLAVVALFAGPLLGVALALVTFAVGGVDPQDRAAHLRSFAIVGSVAGVVGAVMIAVLGGGVRGDGDGEIKGPECEGEDADS